MSPDPARRSPDADNSDGEQWLNAGRIGRPHGLDGSVHVTQPRVTLLEQGRVLKVDGRDDEIVRRAGTDSRPIIRLASCTTRTQAEALRGRELLVSRADAPPLEEDEWWPEELEGCRVHDGDREVGVVRTLRALPSCDVLEVARDGAEDLLVPLIRDAVRSVDVEEGDIDIDLAFLGEEDAGPSATGPSASGPSASGPAASGPADETAGPADPAS
jgi:16S rRNA processing protein RimM